MITKAKNGGAFTWAPQLKYWLKDPAYIFWLGTVRGIIGAGQFYTEQEGKNFRW